MNRGVDIGHHPIDPGEMREAAEDLLESIMGDVGDPAPAERDEIVVEPLEGESVKVREISGDMDFRDLPLASRKVLHAREPSVQEQKALGQLPPRVDDGLVWRIIDDLIDHSADRTFFLGAYFVAATQLSKVNIKHRHTVRVGRLRDGQLEQRRYFRTDMR